MNTDELTLFRERFIHRRDIFAVQTKAHEKWIFLPHREELTDKILARHLDGRITIGAYPGSDSTTKWLVIDIDTRDERELRRVIDAYEQRRVPFLLEHSGRKGFHLWTFFNEPVANRAARSLGAPLAGKHEVFPKQDHTSKDSPGNLVKLPLGVHRATGTWCVFLDPRTLEPQPHQWEALQTAPGMSVRELLARTPRTKVPRAPSRPFSGRGDLPACVVRALNTGTCEGRRNTTAVILAACLVRASSSEAEAFHALAAWNVLNTPPLSERELESVLRSVLRKRYTYACRRIALELGCPDPTCPRRSYHTARTSTPTKNVSPNRPPQFRERSDSMYDDDEISEALESANLYGYVEAVCPVCGDVRTVEPDAENYPCWKEDCTGTLTSPLRENGLI